MAQTILIAEDDGDIADLLTLYLTGEGYRVLAAPDGRQALALLEGRRWTWPSWTSCSRRSGATICCGASASGGTCRCSSSPPRPRTPTASWA